MSDLDALLRAILEHPEEDTPRLMYADALQEQGRDRHAAFIRAQISGGAVRKRPAYEARCAIGESGGAFLEWVTGFGFPSRAVTAYRTAAGVVVYSGYTAGSPAANAERCRLVLRRGFVDEVQCPAVDWIKHGDALLAAHPITSVRLTTWPVVNYATDHVSGKVLVWFFGDQREVKYTAEQVRDSWRPGDLDSILPPLLLMLRLRFGNRVTFTLSG